MKRKEFAYCIEKNELIDINIKDVTLASELLELAKHRQQFWDKVNLEDEFPSMYLEGHYEIIKELCTAILALDGWKALNHECMFAYLKEKKQDLEIDFDYLLEVKDVRNDIDYRGVKVSLSIWKKNKLKVQVTIKALIEYIQKKVVD